MSPSIAAVVLTGKHCALRALVEPPDGSAFWNPRSFPYLKKKQEEKKRRKSSSSDEGQNEAPRNNKKVQKKGQKKVPQ